MSPAVEFPNHDLSHVSTDSSGTVWWWQEHEKSLLRILHHFMGNMVNKIMHIKTCFMAEMLLYLSTLSKLLKHIRRFLRCEGTSKSWYFYMLRSRQTTNRPPGWSVIPPNLSCFIAKSQPAWCVACLCVCVCVCLSLDLHLQNAERGFREGPLLDTAYKGNNSIKLLKRPPQRIIQKHKGRPQLENEHFSHIRSLFPSSKT